MDPCLILYKSVLYRLDNNKIYYVFYLEGSDSVDFGFKLPKIPMHKMLQAYLYMKAVHEAKGTEARLDLLYSFKRKRYRWIPPEQVNTAAGVSYTRTEETRQAIRNGWQIIGSAHSHPNMVGLSHSGTDEADEHQNPGIHFTFAFDRSYGASIFPNLKVYCRLVLTDMFISLSLNDLVDISYGFGFPQNWMDRVSTYTYFPRYNNSNVTVTPYRRPKTGSLYPQVLDVDEDEDAVDDEQDEDDTPNQEELRHYWAENSDNDEGIEDVEDADFEESVENAGGIVEEVDVNPEDLDNLTEVNSEDLIANLDNIDSNPDSIEDPDMPETPDFDQSISSFINDKKK